MSTQEIAVAAIGALHPGDVVVEGYRPEPVPIGGGHGFVIVRREVPGPNLGRATTRQLLDEIAARIEVDYVSGRPAGLDYSTVSGSPDDQGPTR